MRTSWRTSSASPSFRWSRPVARASHPSRRQRANSSNTRALERLAVDAGTERVFRVNSASELPTDLSGVVGVTAGASAPEELVNEVIARLAPVNGVEEVRITTEDEYFPPPRELRELLGAIEVAASVSLGAVGTRPTHADRTVHASDVLAALG